uniref:Uncharacterized protein n=1 Tax=Anguilla anguilla TaxID=7936 RepID=A0A0E9XH02_ANGAN
MKRYWTCDARVPNSLHSLNTSVNGINTAVKHTKASKSCNQALSDRESVYTVSHLTLFTTLVCWVSNITFSI